MIKLVVQGLAFMTLLSHLFILHLAILWILEKGKVGKWYTAHKKRLTPYSFYLAFAVSTTATLGSLFFSEIAKWTPCLLCWYQRIFMYPLPILLYVGIMRNEKIIKPYLLVLSAVGALIAGYHYFIQLYPTSSLVPCDATGVSCTKVYTWYFGYITIPLMAATAFMLNIILLSFSNSKVKSKNVKLQLKT